MALDNPYPKVLVIAGSDSSGGAGLEADQKVLAAHQVYAATATTALTVQNTLGVRDVHITPPDIVGRQIECVLEDLGDGIGVKIGMLASAKTVEVVVQKLQAFNVGAVVFDPVMVSTSGAQLLPSEAVQSLRRFLLPMATILTPNIPEATLLLQDAGVQYKSPENLDDLKNLARMVHGLGPKAVLLKGGHLPMTKDRLKAQHESERELTIDILFDGINFNVIESPYLTSKNTHGTGCSLASAIAANLVRGKTIQQAAKDAIRYVGAGIRTSFELGKGSGPINHFHNVQSLPFTQGFFLEYLLDREDVKHVWRQFTHHKFADQMADGTLAIELFKDYLVQDYLYLVHFARTNALAAYKSKNMDAIAASAQIVSHIKTEMELHLEYCREFGLGKDHIERQKESQACTAYSRYVLDIGQSEDWLALQMALAPCLLGDGNKYWKWVENYTAEDYRQAVKTGSALLEQNITKQSPHRIEELVRIFVRATEMEIQFWEFGAHSAP